MNSTIEQIRPTAVAGLFYPNSADELSDTINAYLANTAQTMTSPKTIKAIVAPHAGYVYSGPIAASAYTLLRKTNSQFNKVILLGPAHRVKLTGIAIPTVQQFDSPLGPINIDQELLMQINQFDFVHESDLAHKEEHCLEVQLPFLQTVLQDFKIVPLLIGDISAEQVSLVLESIWDVDNLLIVVSTDLSHYYDYITAQKLDQKTSQFIEELNSNKIEYDHACGKTALQALLLSAKKHKLCAKTIDLRNSGDTAGEKNKVVGYGAYVIS